MAQDVRHLEFTLDDPDASWQPGDIASIAPHTLPPDIASTAAYLCANPEDMIVITPNTLASPPLPSLFTQPVSVRSLLEILLAPTAPPRRGTLSLLSHFTSDERETERLREMTSIAGQVELKEVRV